MGQGFAFPRAVRTASLVEGLSRNNRALETWLNGHTLHLGDDGTAQWSSAVEGWTEVASPYSNSWVEYDAAGTIRYMKDPWGFVHLSGRIKSGTVDTAIFTLPSAYRPDRLVNLTALDNVGACRVIVSPSTGVVQQANGGGTNFLLLDGLYWYSGW